MDGFHHHALAFALGRVFERLGTMQTTLGKMEVAMWGKDGQDGAFLRRSEAELLLESANVHRAAQKSRMDELAQRVVALENREAG